MVTRRIVLISETDSVPFGELGKVSSAVQKQINEQFGPAWGAQAAIDPLASLADVPPDAWPVVVRDDIGISAAGAHWNETQDKPFALVTFREGDSPADGWQSAVSHEVLEMLADPYGKEFRSGPSLRPGQGPVEYLVEVCDPCQAGKFCYWVDDVPVSDFVLPDYYTAFTSGTYSYAGNITQPRDVLLGGYVSWRDLATGRWGQLVMSKAGGEFRDLGTNPAPPDVHLRGFIDRQTNEYLRQQATRKARKKRRPRIAHPSAAEARSCHPSVRRAQGERWRRRIDLVLHASRSKSPSPPPS
jgi:hypothetical protein